MSVINLGLCCVVECLRNKHKVETFCSRTITRKLFTVEKAKELARKNVADIHKLIDYCIKTNIKCFRLSSDLFPRIDDPNVVRTVSLKQQKTS